MKPKFGHFDYVYALDNAAEFLENEESSDIDQDAKKAQEAANKVAAKTIKQLANRYAKRNGLGVLK